MVVYGHTGQDRKVVPREKCTFCAPFALYPFVHGAVGLMNLKVVGEHGMASVIVLHSAEHILYFRLQLPFRYFLADDEPHDHDRTVCDMGQLA